MVRGKPSRIKPNSPLASPASNLLDSKFIIISSETSFPWFTISDNCNKQQDQTQEKINGTDLIRKVSNQKKPDLLRERTGGSEFFADEISGGDVRHAEEIR